MPARLAAALVLLLVAAAPASAQTDPVCVGDTESVEVPQRPGPLLRFGITPGVQAGQIGASPAPAVPEDPQRSLDALALLRPPNGPFVLRLNRFFWSEGESAFRRFLELAERYTSRGYLVELQVRYHPNEQQEGNIPAWVEHVREVVRRFGSNPRVVALQIANEVNIQVSPDSSDGSYREAREALVRGVIAAKEEARQRGFRQLEIGFNWAYRTDPTTETSFWQALRDRGGQAFVRSLDWIGLDAYPGTVFPPAESEGGERDGLVNGMSALRCYARIPGIPATVPMKIEENGWPTQPPARSYEKQAAVLALMVRAAHDFRGTYNVTDYRWFNLRDGDTSSPLLFQHFGLMESDYVPKPALEVYRRLVAELSRGAGPPRLALLLRGRRVLGGCFRTRVRAEVGGADRGLARRAEFWRDGRRRGRDTNPPLRGLIHRPHASRRHRHRVHAWVRLADGRLIRLARRFTVCARPPRGG